MNVLQAAAVQQAQFTANLAEMGYKTVTTFYADLTIAEEMGEADGWAVENLKGDDLTHYYDVTD